MNETDVLFPANLALLRDAERLPPLDHGAAPPGLLEHREGLCLSVLARRASALGNVVEIGSYKGRSTWYLARALADAGSRFRVVAIDPHLEGTAEEFALNVAGLGVDARTAYAHDVAGEFDEPIGFVWIDGDHAYAAVRQDFEDWFPRLKPDGWIAFHDTVRQWAGPTKLVQELLASRADLGDIGVIGTITFARKVAPRAANRLRAWRSLAAYELLSLFRSARMGPGRRRPNRPG